MFPGAKGGSSPSHGIARNFFVTPAARACAGWPGEFQSVPPMNVPRSLPCLAWIGFLAFSSTALPADEPAPTPAGKAEHIVLMVWDGLRPDSVTEADTPTLARLAREGVTFTRHHPVYPSLTEVNGTAMATGCYPGHSGLIGNTEYRPDLNPLKPVPTESLATIRRSDELSGGKFLLVPTLPELAHAAGWRTVIAGTKPVAILWDRAVRPDAGDMGKESVSVVAGKTLPPDAQQAVDDANGGPFPPDIHYPNTPEDAWTTKALTGALWKDGPPKFSVLWMSDPDYTQHQFGPDSPQARRALASNDANLAAMLAALDAGHWRDQTDVFVVSDHGFSTIEHQLDTAARLTAAGFTAAREFLSPPKPGDVIVNGLSGAVFLYVVGHEKETTQRLVDFLQKSEFAGVILTRDALPGTFSLGTAHVDSPDAPDVIVSMRWNEDKNATGFPGEIWSDGGRRPGQGTHATLSRYDMHNTLVASGPDFRAGFRDELPSSNADLAPTVARLLGLPNLPPMDGRVLTEALSGTAESIPAKAIGEYLEAARETEDIHWRQYLHVTRYGGETYLDAGNAYLPAVAAPAAP